VEAPLSVVTYGITLTGQSGIQVMWVWSFMGQSGIRGWVVLGVWLQSLL